MNIIKKIDMGPKLIKINNFSHNNLDEYSLDLKKINNLFSKLISIKLIRSIFKCNIS